VDSSSTGWITATTSYVSADTLTEFEVTEYRNSLAFGSPQLLTVPEYSYPPSAPQAGTAKSGSPAPPLETRIYLTQVIEAYDPRVGHLALWTAHTIAGGAGSVVRWYEIDPENLKLDQVGTIADPDLWLFNATVTPDRVVVGKKSRYGSSAVVEYSTSSSSTYPAIRMVSIVGQRRHQSWSSSQLVQMSISPASNQMSRYVDGATIRAQSPTLVHHWQRYTAMCGW
jgi:hypothetical protein